MTIEWGDAPAWAASVIAVIAAGIAAWQAAEARNARQRSEKWAADSAREARRANEIAQRALELEEAAARAAEPPKIAWRIEHHRNSAYLLHNDGTEDATGVTADMEGVMNHRLPRNETIRAGGYHQFLVTRSWQKSQANEVIVTWDGAPEPEAVTLPPPS